MNHRKEKETLNGADKSPHQKKADGLSGVIAGQPLYQGEAGSVWPDAVKLFGLTATGRRVITAVPGTPGSSPPPELADPRRLGLKPPQLIGLMVASVALGALVTVAGLPWWVGLILAVLLVGAALAWPATQQFKAVERWARSEESVMLLLSGDQPPEVVPPEVRTLHPEDSPVTLPQGGRSVAVVVYGLPPEARVRLVRMAMGLQAMNARKGSQANRGQANGDKRK